MTTLTVGSEAEAWLHRLVPDLLDSNQLESIVSYTDTQILRDVPEIDTYVLRNNLHASSAALGRVMLPSLITGVTPSELPDEAHVLAESIAYGGLDLKVLLRIYRSGQQAMIRTLSEQIELSVSEVGETRELVMHSAACVADWSGTAIEILSGTFAFDQDPDPAGRFSRRRETVRSIIAGLPVDPATAQMRLGYVLDDSHLAFVLRLEDNASGGLPDLERAAQRIVAHLEARGSFTLACGHRTLWGWARTHRSPTAELSACLAAGGSIHAAFGLPAHGVAGFRRSHLESLATQKMSHRIARPGRLVLYDSIELEHLVSQDQEAMDSFVERELNGLLGADANAVRLRKTLTCYLDSMCSVEATARELGVHRNTVRYRLERIEQLLGHQVASRRLKLEVALRLAAALHN
ncbi:PucR family transcriptional regulator [Nocardia salmonicida]|uniref:PucR family transcriptional regulator n=1 Tax=Nocardia salmonicida TaxID=53431 RepID=UPI0007A45F94|nr:helix-turn-helix domain-containing protein [Nocardia salmonicida]